MTKKFALLCCSASGIIRHEGGEVVTPRVEFHFIDRFTNEQYIAGIDDNTIASPYNFVNTSNEYQTTQIIKSGEMLELINDPANISYVDNGKTTEKYFFGWYVVDLTTANVTRDASTGKYTGEIKFAWTSDPKKIAFDQALSITPATGVAIGSQVTWTLGEASGTGELDADGSVHVYIAPLYEDFYFLNFRKGYRTSAGNTGLENSIMTRKLVIFGNGTSTEVRIGNVFCESPDPTHKIFAGWEEDMDGDGTFTFHKTVRHVEDETGSLVNVEETSAGHSDGYYITVSKTEHNVSYLDLYPVFDEARWLYFDRGATGNGASYVGAAYRLTNDLRDPSDNSDLYYFNKSFFTGDTDTMGHLSSRRGFRFNGWYLFANMDATTGEITNLTTPQDVTVKYLDANGAEQTATIHTTAIQLVKPDGTINNVGTYSVSGSAIVNNEVSGSELFTADGTYLRFYKTLNDMMLYANWVEDTDTNIRVIIWKQKVTDDKNTTKTPVDLLNWLAEDTSRKAADYPYTVKEYDYEIFYTSSVSTGAVPDLTSFSGTGADGNTLPNANLLTRSYTGFHYSANDVSVVGTPNPNGTSVYNVYYDRDLRAINFYYYTYYTGISAPSGAADAYQYTVTTSNNGTQYGIINDQYVQLTYTGGKWTAPEYAYQYQVDNTNGTYGLVNGKYVELTPVTSSITVYALTNTLAAGNEYLIVSRNSAGSGYALGHSGTTVAADAVTVNSGSPVYISESDIDDTSVWTVANGYTLRNGNYYLGRNNTNLQISTASSNWSWYQNNNMLYQTTGSGYGRTYYSIHYNNGFALSTNYEGAYLYQKTTTSTITGYTYDNNGTPTPYTGENRYSYNYVATGRTAEYTETRFTRSNNTLGNNWRLVTWSGLYGQSFAQSGYSWDDVSGYRWYEGTTGNSGTMQTFLDSFIQDTNPYNLSTRQAVETASVIYHYRQQLDGTYSQNDMETAYGSGGNFNFTNKFEGFTVSTYSTGNNGFSASGGNNAATGSSNRYPLHVYHTRNKYDLTFDVNYPVDAFVVFSDGQSSNLTVENIYYQALLSTYATRFGVDSGSVDYTIDLKGPDHYIFGGWYEDKSCTVPFNFGSTMPVGNKIVYAKWTPETFRVKINPNGGEINRVDQTDSYYVGLIGSMDSSNVVDESPFAGTYMQFDQYVSADSMLFPGSGHTSSGQATYINAKFGEAISEYAVPRRFVAMSDAVADQYEDAGGTSYYYVNYQLRGTDGVAGVYTHVRSAVYLTDAEISRFYQLYKACVSISLSPAYVDQNAGMQLLDESTWRSIYVSSERYRPLNSSESWTFLGWFKTPEGGTEEPMPYNFSDPTTGNFTLTAHWRLDGGYTIQYVPEYTMPDGAVINGTMPQWVDPIDASLTYADGAATQIYKAPTNLTITTAGSEPQEIRDDSVIFRGWALVNAVYDPTGTTIIGYRPAEVDTNGNITTYYYPSDAYSVNAANAGLDSKLYFQAIYQYKDSSERRPTVTNLTLDANTGYVNTADSDALPAWVSYPGISAINTTDHLDSSGHPTQILFGDIQSSAAVHLYQYATEDTDTGLNGGHNYFSHPEGYFLLGFDDTANEGDYIATYAADAVIAVTRNDNQTLYAVWEPMVYVTFVNKTEGTITFTLNSTDGALEIINVKHGMYDRESLSNYEIVMTPTGTDDSIIRLAFPKGAEKNITISGTNDLGPGKVLIWDTSIALDGGRTYSTNPQVDPDLTNDEALADSSFTHDTNCTHPLASGEKNNLQSFSFGEKLVVNKEPLTVTFTSRDNAYALLLNDNWNGDGTGGGMQEIDYGLADIQPDPDTGAIKTQDLPGTSTRLGYSFLGWAYAADATLPDFPASSGVIADLNKDNGFFSTGTVTVDGVVTRTLYGVWEPLKDAVYIHKDVPAPGNQSRPFDFTLAITGSYHVGTNTYTISDTSRVFSIKHGEYLRIVTTVDNATESGHTTAFVQAEVEVYYPVTNNGTVTYVKDTTRSAIVRWDRTVQTPNDNNGFNPDLKVTVTETSTINYTTTVTRDYEEHAGDLTTDANTAFWKYADAHGTVTFHNTITTYDVSVEKTLITNRTGTENFPFTASYLLDQGTPYEQSVELFTVTNSFVVSGGSTNDEALRGIPAGAELTVSETVEDFYATRVTADGGTNWTDGTAFTLTVDGDKTLGFENTLKSYPVTFKLVDQDGNPLSAMFNLTGAEAGPISGASGTDLYAGTNGIFYSSPQFWADTYTLVQTTTPTGYISLQGTQIRIDVTGSSPYITADNDWVTVTPNDASDPSAGFVITVKNWAQKTVTVKKVLNDILLNRRTFNFTYSYTLPAGLGGTTVSGNFSLAPISINPAGETKNLIIPADATDLVITELTTGADEIIGKTYDTVDDGVWANNGPMTDLNDAETVFAVDTVTDDATVTFTNTRKEIEITLVKRVVGGGGTFSFEATVKNGVNVLTNYNANGFVAGKQTIDLTVAFNGNNSIMFKIPYGTVLDLTELPVEGNYDTSAKGTKDSDSSSVASGTLSITLTADKTVEDLTVTFTNTEVIVAPTGVAEETGSSWWMLAVGLALVPGAAVPFVLKKRKENEDRA